MGVLSAAGREEMEDALALERIRAIRRKGKEAWEEREKAARRNLLRRQQQRRTASYNPEG